jgi:hypothetical protein
MPTQDLLTVETRARFTIERDKDSRMIANVSINFGPSFEQRLYLGWVSDTTSCAASGLGRDSIPQFIIDRARTIFEPPKEPEPVAPTRFERILESNG